MKLSRRMFKISTVISLKTSLLARVQRTLYRKCSSILYLVHIKTHVYTKKILKTITGMKNKRKEFKKIH